MDDISQTSRQDYNQMDKLVQRICNTEDPVTLSHVIKPRICVETKVVPNAINARILRFRPAAKFVYLPNSPTKGNSSYNHLQADSLSQILLQERINMQGKGRHSHFGGGEDEELIFVIEVDSMFSLEFTQCMVLLGERAWELRHENASESRWKMHIITVSVDKVDPRLERFFVRSGLADPMSHWIPYRTYPLEWVHHGMTGDDVSLAELCASSNGSISCELFEENIGEPKKQLTIPLLNKIRNSNARRILVICFRPWGRVGDLFQQLEEVHPEIISKIFCEEGWMGSKAIADMKRDLEVLEMTSGSSKAVYVACILPRGADTIARSFPNIRNWSVILITGHNSGETFVDFEMNQTLVTQLKFPCIEEQLDQLSWARLSDETALVIISAEDSQMIYENWGKSSMDDEVRMKLFPEPEYSSRMVRIENDQLASFICAMIALEAVAGIDASTVLQAMIMRRDAMLVTLGALRYQGVIGDASSPTLQLPEAMGIGSKSHDTFLRLLKQFDYKYEPTLIVCNSWNDDAESLSLNIFVACALAIGLNLLINKEDLSNIFTNDAVLTVLQEKCTGPFKGLAGSGTIWLKLALMHRAVWINGKLGNQLINRAYIRTPNFPLELDINGHAYIVNVISSGIHRLRELFGHVVDIMGRDQAHEGEFSTSWTATPSDDILWTVQRRMLEAYVLSTTLSQPHRVEDHLYGIRSDGALKIRYKYIQEMIKNISRTAGRGRLGTIFGLTPTIPRGVDLIIEEWVFMPRDMLISWHNDHHGEEQRLLQGLIPS